MKKKLKLLLGCVAGLFLLVGCISKGERDSTGTNYGNFDNLSHEEVYKQIREQMKSEMDKIGFTIDFSNYEFETQILQTEGHSGIVTMRDKRYSNYKGVTVYKGQFGSEKNKKSIDKKQIATNPIVFVINGYQDYVVKNVLNNKSLGNDIEGALAKSDGKLLKYMSGFSYDLFKETELYPGIVTSESKLISDISTSTSFLFSLKSIANQDYVMYFKDKNNSNFNYGEMLERFKFITRLGIYVNVNDKQIGELQKEMKVYYNNELLVIGLTTTNEN